ncbi:MAG: methyltransferase domain-containing protein, partial [Pseudomonadales bacterium]|nr:methyltransferase domain-containing protein [Pseudomonadales bacterium]
RSRAFFARHADRLDAARELIATPADYLKELGDLLPTSGERALEIGPGPGEFLPVLAARFREVVALDSAAGMIERARETCRQAGLDNVRFETGEPPAPGQPLRPAALARPFDAIVCAMVLHHVPRPEDLLARAAALLSDAGALLVADLCPHEQDWVGEACGDVWRGIDADRLDHWAADAGLAAGPAQFLALRNGFRIQLKCFRRRHAPPAATDLHTPGSKETPR